MAVTKCLVLVLALCAVALAETREKRGYLGVYPYAAAAAYPYAAAAYPYAAYPYAAAGYPYAAYPYAAAGYPYAYAYKVQDDGSYFPGKYGPES